MSLDDYAANIDTTGNLGSFLGTNYLDTSFSIEGNIEVANDKDWFAITFDNPGTTFRIDLKGKDGDVRLFKDEWRSAGTSSQKVASYYEDDMKECMKDKVDADRKANREKNGLGK